MICAHIRPVNYGFSKDIEAYGMGAWIVSVLFKDKDRGGSFGGCSVIVFVLIDLCINEGEISYSSIDKTKVDFTLKAGIQSSC